MPKTIAQRAPRGPREGLTGAKVFRFISLPFRPGSLKTYLAVDRFEDLPIDRLLADGVRGVLVDADGTLCPHHATVFSESVVQKVREMTERGLKVALFTNALEDRFHAFPGIAVVTGVPAKPDPRGFLKAMKEALQLDRPEDVCMVGDNYITDGGAITVGMRFIHVRPLAGPESWIHALCRRIAWAFARLYHPGTFQTRRR